MKPKMLGKKLQLNKKTVANLNLDEMKKLMGGNQDATHTPAGQTICIGCG